MPAGSDPNRSRSLAVFDLDGTITRRDTLLPLLGGYLLHHPWRMPRLVLVVPNAVAYVFGRRDRGALKGALIHAVLGGVARADVDAWVARFVLTLLKAGLFVEAVERIAEHKQEGHRMLLMSASPDFYVPRIAAALGFDECICTEVRWRPDGRLDGRLQSPNRRGPEKTRCLQRFLASHPASQIYAYGNSKADLEHMGLATEGWYINGASGVATLGKQVRIVRWNRPGGL